MKNKLNILLVSIIIILVFVWSGTYLRASKAESNFIVMHSWVNFWQNRASLPDLTCKLRGGQYHETRLIMEFGTGKVTKSFACEDMIFNEGGVDTGGLIMQLR